MKRLKLLGVAIVALLAFATALASSASAAALPQNLPELSTERAFTGEASGTVTFETVKGQKIECETAKAEGKEESKKPLGTVHVHLLGCTGTINKVKSKCNSLGDTSGQVLVLIKWHLVYDLRTPELRTEVLALKVVHVECATGTVLVLIEGSLGCLHQNPTVKGKTHETKCEQEKGVPKDKLYFNEKEEMTSSSLLTSINGGTAEESAEQATLTGTTTEETVADQ